jgi:hypothetical protein
MKTENNPKMTSKICSLPKANMKKFYLTKFPNQFSSLAFFCNNNRRFNRVALGFVLSKRLQQGHQRPVPI